MVEPVFEDKFVAFMDVMGFTDMIETAERGTGRSLQEIQCILGELARFKDKEFYAADGPQVCPSSSYLRKDLAFEITQVSDCAVVSSEVSPAGVINLINHCWGAVISLMAKGVMVRGYITRGQIYHKDRQFMGTGYNTAYRREAGVTAFKKEADEKGTPFVEVDVSVRSYIANECDKCVKEMYARMTKEDGDVTAVFPFQSLTHWFAFGGFGVPRFDAAKERRSNGIMRKWLQDYKARLLEHVDSTNENAQRKVRHYITALDAQILECDKMDEFITVLGSPFPRRR